MYGNHYAPHDIKAHTIGSFGMSTWEQAHKKGLTFEVMPKLKIEAGIEASRALFSSCWFDAVKCEHGIDALKTYRYEYKEDVRAYQLKPVHDWSSDGADAFRTLGVCHQFKEKEEEMKDIDYGDPDDYAGYYKGGL
jgi:phage terminase large subunit